jgi:hypothetical protein
MQVVSVCPQMYSAKQTAHLQYFCKVCIMQTVSRRKKNTSSIVQHERYKKLFLLDDTKQEHKQWEITQRVSENIRVVHDVLLCDLKAVRCVASAGNILQPVLKREIPTIMFNCDSICQGISRQNDKEHLLHEGQCHGPQGNSLASCTCIWGFSVSCLRF